MSRGKCSEKLASGDGSIGSVPTPEMVGRGRVPQDVANYGWFQTDKMILALYGRDYLAAVFTGSGTET